MIIMAVSLGVSSVMCCGTFWSYRIPHAVFLRCAVYLVAENESGLILLVWENTARTGTLLSTEVDFVPEQQNGSNEKDSPMCRSLCIHVEIDMH